VKSSLCIRGERESGDSICIRRGSEVGVTEAQGTAITKNINDKEHNGQKAGGEATTNDFKCIVGLTVSKGYGTMLDIPWVDVNDTPKSRKEFSSEPGTQGDTWRKTTRKPATHETKEE